GSKRYPKLQAARRKVSARKRRQIRDLRYKRTPAAITCCQQQGVGSLFIGDPHGVRNCNSGRHHSQRLAQWEDGQDLAYLSYKARLAPSECFTGSERGTSSQCPICGWQQKARGVSGAAVTRHARLSDTEMWWAASTCTHSPLAAQSTSPLRFCSNGLVLC